MFGRGLRRREEMPAHPANLLAVITLWVMEDRPFSLDLSLVGAMLGEARALGPNAQVEVYSLAWRRAWSRLRVAIPEGALPDVLEVGTTWLPALIALGILVPAGAERPRRPRWPQRQGEEGRYGIPWRWDMRFLYYSPSELARIGMRPADLATMAGLKEAARRVRDGGRREAIALCGKPEPTLVQEAAAWVWAEGGEFLATGGQGGLFPGAPGFRGLMNLLSWVRDGLLAPSALEQGAVEVLDRFAAGEYAFVLASSLSVPADGTGEPDISAVPVPVGRSARTTFSGGSYLTVTRCSPDPARAWETLEHLMTRMRPAFAAHHQANRQLIRSACAEAGLALSAGGFLADRLHGMPRLPVWASMESHLADALADWLREARRGRLESLEREVGALARDLARAAAL